MSWVFRDATEDELASWNELIAKNPDGGDLFQTKEMGLIKKSQGWSPGYWVAEGSGRCIYILALTRRVYGFGEIIYIIRGPGIVDYADLASISESLRLWRPSAVFIKIEPLFVNAGPDITGLLKVRAIQPNVSTIVVDIRGSDSEILSSFRPRARREIKAGEKSGIMIRRVDLTPGNMRIMYDLYKTTSRRAGFFIKPEEYFKFFWTTYGSTNGGRLYFAFMEGEDEPLAGAFIMVNGKKAVYKDGGSRRTGHKHFAHLLQWNIIKDLRDGGIESYDLHGVPPADSLHDPSHPMAGLAMFKLSFSQNIVQYVGAYDVVIKKNKYAAWSKYGEKVYTKILQITKKINLY